MRPTLPFALWMLSCGLVFSKSPAKPEVDTEVPASVSELTQIAKRSVVTITQIGRGGMQEALGAGFVVSEDGLIATNKHVIGTSRRLQVRLSDGTVHEVSSIHATDPILDIAVIRIDKKDLSPLPLGDSDKVAQGMDVVALGHPQGLQYSVVEGVVSALREVEGCDMIQLAIPIEEGNSGGPLLDRYGRVEGIVTLKSAITENLGFAHPVNQLKHLLEKPNPIPMSRWLTIGVLDAKRWEPCLGGRWTQHAGVIHVEEGGDGGFGRALCLSQDGPPSVPFEASVVVKLDDESGAAGLAFCSDGGDRHYGFYPSSGKLRLTRFNGPDVTSWTVLADLPTSAYRRGEWNTLRVRVEEAKIQCFVNDKLVTEQEDGMLRGGKAGLCKFRQTKADFKGFRVGANLAATDLPEKLASQLQSEVEAFLKQPSDKDDAVEKLANEPLASRRILEDRVRFLEEQAASLKKLEREVHRQSVTAELVRLLQRPADQTELFHAALLIAKHDNPEIDVPSYLRVMDRMVEELRSDETLKKGPASAASRISHYLFEENGFHGSRGDEIRELANSHLDEVLDDREGIPITLSIIYLELARRLGAPGIYGVALPGRFMLAYDDNSGGLKTTTYIDVFDRGRLLNRLEVEGLIFRTSDSAIEDRQFDPATPRAMVLRMLYSLSSFATKPSQSLPYLDLILAIDPQSAEQRLERARCRLLTNDFTGARKDLDKLLEGQPPEPVLEKAEMLYQALP